MGYMAEALAGYTPPGVPATPPGSEPPGTEGGKEIFKRVHYMETKLHLQPEKCTGIFAGSSGELEFIAPEYAMAGHLIVETRHGELRMDFMESGTREKLTAQLRVDGEREQRRLGRRRGRARVHAGRSRRPSSGAVPTPARSGSSASCPPGRSRRPSSA